jgi:hypothetical protein
MIPVPDRLAMKLILAIGCVVLLALLIHDRNHWKAKTAHYAERLAAERGAHSATVAGYRAAAAQARAADAANAARVKADQAAINERTADDYQNRIAAARAAAGGLRRTAGAATDPGGGGATPVPGLSAAAARAAESAGQDGLSPPERLIATEQAIQLDELIHWVKAQREVEVGGR